uniref:Uncharacterized protein n=1 Tax=Romanomermis culicivorax TaxID=13658 RepID=A0A915J013_ROMCU
CDTALHKSCVTLFDDPCNAVRNGKQAQPQRSNAPDALRKAPQPVIRPIAATAATRTPASKNRPQRMWRGRRV